MGVKIRNVNIFMLLLINQGVVIELIVFYTYF